MLNDSDDPMEDLLKAEAAAEAADVMRPVLAAAEAGDVQALMAALDAKNLGVDTQGEDGDTALHIGCLYGQLAIVEECIRRGADVTAKDEDNSTPLHDASAGGHYDIAKLLLSKGASPTERDEDGDTPLHNATNGGHAAVAQLLLSHLNEKQRSILLGLPNSLGQTPADLAEDPALVAQLKIAAGEDADDDGRSGSAFKKTRS